MLRMVSYGCSRKGPAADAHDALEWPVFPKQASQLMLMMLGGPVLDMVVLQLLWRRTAADAHDALGWLGRPKKVWQLMLVMLGE